MHIGLTDIPTLFRDNRSSPPIHLPEIDTQMSSLAGFIELVSPYVNKYGPISGARLGIAMRRARWGSQPGTRVPVSVPKIPFPVHLRAGSSDAGIFDQVFLEEHQTPPLRQPPATIVDLGANIGLTSVQYANLFPDARIIAVEPEPGNHDCLLQNIARYPTIESTQRGIWDHECSLRVANQDAQECAFRLEECEPGDSGAIDAVSVPWLMDHYGLDAIDLLKIDIEGGEVELFRNGRPDWMERVKVMLVELHDRLRPGCSEALQSALRPNEKTYRHGEYTVVELNP